jgi:hypothetical protein
MEIPGMKRGEYIVISIFWHILELGIMVGNGKAMETYERRGFGLTSSLQLVELFV